MKEFKWNSLKNERLKKVRGASFEDIIIGSRLIDRLIDIGKHHKKESQKIMFFEYKNYIWAVPYIEDESHIFLKTLYPSRKYTKLYKKGGLK